MAEGVLGQAGRGAGGGAAAVEGDDDGVAVGAFDRAIVGRGVGVAVGGAVGGADGVAVGGGGGGHVLMAHVLFGDAVIWSTRGPLPTRQQ